jgi:hypothetical protein
MKHQCSGGLFFENSMRISSTRRRKVKKRPPVVTSLSKRRGSDKFTHMPNAVTTSNGNEMNGTSVHFCDQSVQNRGEHVVHKFFGTMASIFFNIICGNCHPTTPWLTNYCQCLQVSIHYCNTITKAAAAKNRFLVVVENTVLVYYSSTKVSSIRTIYL